MVELFIFEIAHAGGERIVEIDTNLVVEGDDHFCSNLTLAWEALQDSGQLWHSDGGDAVEIHK